MSSSEDDFQFYYYNPSLAAAIIFTILFGLVTTLHTFLILRSRTWFLIAFLIGGICTSLALARQPPNKTPHR